MLVTDAVPDTFSEAWPLPDAIATSVEVPLRNASEANELVKFTRLTRSIPEYPAIEFRSKLPAPYRARVSVPPPAFRLSDPFNVTALPLIVSFADVRVSVSVPGLSL